MNARDIDILVDQGFWIQVSPLANAGSGWICGVYKRGKKSIGSLQFLIIIDIFFL